MISYKNLILAGIGALGVACASPVYAKETCGPILAQECETGRDEDSKITYMRLAVETCEGRFFIDQEGDLERIDFPLEERVETTPTSITVIDVGYERRLPKVTKAFDSDNDGTITAQEAENGFSILRAIKRESQTSNYYTGQSVSGPLSELYDGFKLINLSNCFTGLPESNPEYLDLYFDEEERK